MARNTVTGKNQKAEGRRQVAGRSGQWPVVTGQQLARQRPADGTLITAHCPLLNSRRGFTLLELMIVITIIIILAAIVLPQYQKTILVTREAVLRDDLYKMRSLLDQYAADKQKLPQSLEDLVSEGYMRELPKDPMTDQIDWTVVTGDDPNSSNSEQGIVDVHSASADISSEGTPYSEW